MEAGSVSGVWERVLHDAAQDRVGHTRDRSVRATDRAPVFVVPDGNKSEFVTGNRSSCTTCGMPESTSHGNVVLFDPSEVLCRHPGDDELSHALNDLQEGRQNAGSVWVRKQPIRRKKTVEKRSSAEVDVEQKGVEVPYCPPGCRLVPVVSNLG